MTYNIIINLFILPFLYPYGRNNNNNTKNKIKMSVPTPMEKKVNRHFCTLLQILEHLSANQNQEC